MQPHRRLRKAEDADDTSRLQEIIPQQRGVEGSVYLATDSQLCIGKDSRNKEEK